MSKGDRKFVSTHGIGDCVVFAIDNEAEGTVAYVKAVRFTKNKVTYDLNAGWGQTLRNIDSFFVHKLH